ncbi:MAG: undecaprenyl-diphosphatase UppP [Thermoleophilia bacterium]|nr:undecaprenyl-diphosphatase UppP [Thermoleophilia bacterium]
MSLLEALILGIVQGLTEFLPVSSSAHLVLVPDVMGWDPPSVAFDLVLHLGTMVAVLAYFWRDILEIIRAFSEKGKAAVVKRRIGLFLVIGTIPAAVIGGLFASKFEEFFVEPAWVAFFLIITGVLLVASQKVSGTRALHGRGAAQMKISDTLWIGFTQAAAILPGISRSGSTISTGLFLGLKRETAARYSFLLSVPIIAGAAVFQLRHGFGGGDGEGGSNGETMATLVVGFIAAAISGFAAVKFLLGFVRHHSLAIFAIYCWVVGGAVLISKLIG